MRSEMILRNAALWFYRQMTARSREHLLSKLRYEEQLPIAVLFYHRVADVHLTPWTISTSDFKYQLDWLQENFDLVSLAEAQQRIRASTNDRYTVAITFDDGYAENAQFAIPELVSRNIPVTYFVTTDYIDGSRGFDHDLELGINLPIDTWDQLRMFAEMGVEIGAHTKSHCDLAKVDSPQQLYQEIVGSCQDVEREIGKPCKYFAFPYGFPAQLSQAAVDILHQHGVQAMCSAYGALNWPGSPGFHIRRIHGDPSLERLKNWLTLDQRHLVDLQKLQFVEPKLTPTDASQVVHGLNLPTDLSISQTQNSIL